MEGGGGEEKLFCTSSLCNFVSLEWGNEEKKSFIDITEYWKRPMVRLVDVSADASWGLCMEAESLSLLAFTAIIGLLGRCCHFVYIAVYHILKSTVL